MDEKTIAEVHKDLIAQAEANAQVNSDAHAAQVAENKAFQDKMDALKNPPKPAPTTEGTAEAHEA